MNYTIKKPKDDEYSFSILIRLNNGVPMLEWGYTTKRKKFVEFKNVEDGDIVIWGLSNGERVVYKVKGGELKKTKVMKTKTKAIIDYLRKQGVSIPKSFVIRPSGTGKIIDSPKLDQLSFDFSGITKELTKGVNGKKSYLFRPINSRFIDLHCDNIKSDVLKENGDFYIERLRGVTYYVVINSDLSVETGKARVEYVTEGTKQVRKIAGVGKITFDKKLTSGFKGIYFTNDEDKVFDNEELNEYIISFYRKYSYLPKVIKVLSRDEISTLFVVVGNSNKAIIMEYSLKRG